MIERLARAVYRRLAPRSRNSLRTWLLLELRDQPAHTVEAFPEQRVLVLAPHSDDEVIGCGGTIARHVEAGAVVDVLVMTDGCRGDARLFEPGVSHAERLRLEAELVSTRQAESLAAGREIGVRAVHFLDFRDGQLRAGAETIAALADQLQAFAPELVYLPFVFDLHEDHWQTNRIFAEASMALVPSVTRRLVVRGYEVWTPLPANRLVDIGAQMWLKRRALACFASQLRDQNYLRTADGLAAYRSGGAFGGHGHAEAFYEAPLAAYRQLVRSAALRHSSPAPAAAVLATTLEVLQ